ncbi:hypothetical protein OG625_23185 [Streptomyces sp. NBC_01351]|uniref:hypothetical protein n=1 Tax=Streptomyces sp. NBC_01351 TaxID=2903833 RepID=UPI002E3156D7|nr:hypothetical protein [Streptomyces sp. NBC_01351]
MSAERAQGRGWVRIPASRGEQPAAARTAGHDPARAPAGSAAASPHRAPAGSGYGSTYPSAYQPGAVADQATIYLTLVNRWREAGRTLPGHPDEEWERLISQPCWPGR